MFHEITRHKSLTSNIDVSIHLRALLGALGGESGQKCLLEVGVRRLRCGDTGRFCVSASGDPRPRLMSSRLRERGVMASPRCGTSGVTLGWSGLLLAVIVRLLYLLPCLSEI